jgi:hypothetical protein
MFPYLGGPDDPIFGRRNQKIRPVQLVRIEMLAMHEVSNGRLILAVAWRILTSAAFMPVTPAAGLPPSAKPAMPEI